MPARRGRHPQAGGSEPTWTPRRCARWRRPNPPCSGSPTRQHRAALPSLVGAVEADLVVVGGGYTGLWTALQAKEADPGRDVVLVEAATIGWAASGRNGGFCASEPDPRRSQRPGPVPGRVRHARTARPGEPRRHRSHHHQTRIDAEFERTGELDIAVEDWQVAELTEFAQLLAEHGAEPSLVRPRPDPGAGALADLPREPL